MEKYSISIEWSDEDQAYIATIPEFKNLSAFGNTYEEALNEAKIVLDGYIKSLKSENVPLPEPFKVSEYSGQTRLRMPKSLHRALAIAAKQQGVSLNTHMVMLLSINYAFTTLLKTYPLNGKHILITSLEVRGVGSESAFLLPRHGKVSLGSISDRGPVLEV